MRYAIISDIHGNLPALELALQEAHEHGANELLFVGDYCTSAPWGREVTEKLQSMPHAKAVCGNEEAYLHLPQGDDGQFQVTYWSARQLSSSHFAWLDALPERLDWEFEGVSLHMAHKMNTFTGDAAIDLFRTSRLPLRYPDGPIPHDFFLQDIRSTLANDKDFQQSLQSLPSGVYLFGDTHTQWHARFGDHLFINPGSCGLNLDCSDFGAAYTLLTIENGQCHVEERRIPYDPEALIAQVRQTEQYCKARVWSELIFEEWRTCRERVTFFLRFAESYAQKIGDERRPFPVDTWEAAYERWKQEPHP